MKSTIKASGHSAARVLFDLRIVLNAARAALGCDRAIARPLPTQAVSETDYWNDALVVSKCRGQVLLREADKCTQRLMDFVGRRNETELGTLVIQIKESIEWAWRCLHEHGDAPNNCDRMGASIAIETAWNLSASAIRLYFACALSTKPQETGDNK